jgi:cation:H+ antiporter
MRSLDLDDDQPKKKKSPDNNNLSDKFNLFTHLKKDYLGGLSVVGATLLGTTALSSTLLTSTVAATAGLAASIALLAGTSDVVVDNAKALGNKIGWSPLLVGIGLGAVTSFPELFVSVGSIMQGSPELGIGNIVGSNIANILLILGATAALKPMQAKDNSWKFNLAAMAGCTAAFGTQMAMGVLTPVAAGAMFGVLGLYMMGSYKLMKRGKSKDKDSDDGKAKKDKNPSWFYGLYGLAGGCGLFLAADLLIKTASTIGTNIGVSEAVIGSLVMAFGTSLPELVVSLKSAFKGSPEMAIGNVLGSNIFNILMVGGAIALSSVAVPAAFGTGTALGVLNLTAFGASAAFLGARMLMNKGSITRTDGIIGLGLYGAFTAATVAFAGSSAPEIATTITTKGSEIINSVTQALPAIMPAF